MVIFVCRIFKEMLMKLIPITVLAIALSGCVVAPVGTRPVIRPEVQIEFPVYPVYSDAYVWDPRVELYFFWHRGERYYMPRGWRWDHRRVPDGRWHGHKEFGSWRHR
jgi:hypothetical protein